MATLPLSPVVDVSINVAGNTGARNDFSMGLILGNSPVITQADRVKVFRNMQEVAAAGFNDAHPEYQAAALYFSQTPTPPQLAIGLQAGEEDGNPEDVVDALMACRKKNSEWYGLITLNNPHSEELELEKIAAFAESDGSCIYFVSGISTTLLEKFAAKNYKRTAALLRTNNHSAAALMGCAMGLNAQNKGAGFTLAYKSLPGVKTNSISSTEDLDKVEGLNGNVYITRGGAYDIVEPGVVTDGTYFDEVLGLDMLKDTLQNNVMTLLTSKNKVPQTEDGMTEIINVLNAGCQAFVDSGFIAPGVWNGPAILNLNTGDMLEKGFLFQTQPLALQLQQDREERKAPTIYGAIKLAGAMQHVSIALTVNR